MSHIPNGGSEIFIAGNTSGNWWYRQTGGWPGDTQVQAQPLNTGAALVSVPGSVNLNPDGTYTFWTKISNTSTNSTYFNLQVSNN
jgi:hypothetical protein